MLSLQLPQQFQSVNRRAPIVVQRTPATQHNCWQSHNQQHSLHQATSGSDSSVAPQLWRPPQPGHDETERNLRQVVCSSSQPLLLHGRSFTSLRCTTRSAFSRWQTAVPRRHHEVKTRWSCTEAGSRWLPVDTFPGILERE